MNPLWSEGRPLTDLISAASIIRVIRRLIRPLFTVFFSVEQYKEMSLSAQYQFYKNYSLPSNTPRRNSTLMPMRM